MPDPVHKIYLDIDVSSNIKCSAINVMGHINSGVHLTALRKTIKKVKITIVKEQWNVK